MTDQATENTQTKPRRGIKQTTLRVDAELFHRFEQVRHARGNDMTEVLTAAIRRYVEEPPRSETPAPRTVDSLAAILADEVSRHLRSNRAWAEAVVQSATHLAPALGSVDERMTHYLEEKECLSSQFLPWLLRRIECYLGQGKHVTLVVDSGTTLYHILKSLPARLTDLVRTGGEAHWKNLQVVTNNLSGVEAFMRASALGPLEKDARKLISDVVPCFSLPGEILPVYEAVTGPHTNHGLRKAHKLAPKDSVFIGLLTGNWVLMNDSGVPTPLARGKGHRQFKEELLAQCDEAYVLAPLGKMIIDKSPDKLNEILKYTASTENPSQGVYEEVRWYSKKASAKTKLVSTLRRGSQLLSNHSIRLAHLLGVRETGTMEVDVKTEISKVPHFLYMFDQHAQQLAEQQFLIEFPHKNTRESEGFAALFWVTRPPVRVGILTAV